MTLKMAVFAPMPTASMSTAIPENMGVAASWRSIDFRRMANETPPGVQPLTADVAGHHEASAA